MELRLPYEAAEVDCMVRLNGASMGSLVLDGKQDQGLQIEIPAGQVAAIRLDFKTERLLMPKAGGQRLLGIGIRHLYICAAEDLESRLAYFEDRVATPVQRFRRG
jgi:hypothetical protein